MFADIIVDISHEAVDRAFEYVIPAELESDIKRGSQVYIPFGKGNKLKLGFVVNIKNKAVFPAARLKKIDSIAPKSTAVDSSMIELADFIRTNYGGTMSQALKTVLPVKKKSDPVVEKFICLDVNDGEALQAAETFEKKKNVAKVRLLRELINEKVLPRSIVKDRLNISDSTIKALERDGIVRTDIRTNLRDTIGAGLKQGYEIVLNESQLSCADVIWERFENGDRRPSLIYGITGSGKTEIYIELIERMRRMGRQAVVLIPEIALTYQTVMRFYKKFGSRISVINSRLTPAQKYDQLEKARKGDVDVIIGPRSALFSPFKDLGIIIIDEEHEGTYRNENVPRYDARDVAIKRAEIAGGIVVLGSATPSVESFYKAEKNIYELYTLERRAKGAELAQVEVVDLRDELKKGSRSMVSTRLYDLINDRLGKKEQVILFINRRGHSSFVSCRECGQVMLCPHCDVSLKYHKNGMLMCHYCGYETPMVRTCPNCGSKYIGTFGTGTQKVEEEINRLFPQARTLRMDLDTTKEKDGHEKILSAFANGEADILIGTQMIVKGHDFANVTLVGVMAADLSLYSNDYQAPERTFQLITQAAGRAGRGSKKGNVVIQTYSPDNYAVRLGAQQDYRGFYGFEMDYRKLLGYPPAVNMLDVLISSADENRLEKISGDVAAVMKKACSDGDRDVWIMGPVKASVFRINDRFRMNIFLKSKEYEDLVFMKDRAEEYLESQADKDIQTTFDFFGLG